MLGRWVFGVVAVGTLVVACAEPPPVKKKAAICDPSVSDCPTNGPRHTEKDGTLKTTTGAPLEAPEAEAKKAKSGATAGNASDAGAGATDDDDDIPLPTPRPDLPEEDDSDPLAGVGPKCIALWSCCYDLRQAGITGSANQCDDTALGNDEITCEIANENYKTPDDYYDPVCF